MILTEALLYNYTFPFRRVAGAPRTEMRRYPFDIERTNLN